MATFRLESPSGEKYTIEAPEGATEAQAYEMLQSQLRGKGKASKAGAPIHPEKGVEGALISPDKTSTDRDAQRVLKIMQKGSESSMTEEQVKAFDPSLSLTLPNLNGVRGQSTTPAEKPPMNPVLAAAPGTLPGEPGGIEATPSPMRQMQMRLDRMLGRKTAPLTGIEKQLEEMQQEEEERRQEIEESDKETGFNLRKLAKEGTVGGLVAAGTPEALIAGGRLVGKRFPVAGAGMVATGEVMKATRGGAILAGVLGATSGEAAQQGLQEMDAPVWAQLAGNIGGNILGGNVGRLAAHIPHASRSAAAYFYKSVHAVEEAERRAQPFKAFADIIGKTDRRAEAYEMLHNGAVANEEAAAKLAGEIRRKAYGLAGANPMQAPAIIERAEAEAKQVVAEARAARDKMEKLSKGRTETARRVNAQTEVALNKIAPAITEEQSGNRIVGAIDSAHRHLLESRSAAYKTQESVIEGIVKSKEQFGVAVHETPSYQRLLADVQKRTLTTGAAQKSAGGLAKTTESSSLLAEKRVEEALLGRFVDGKQFKTSYEALDELRRKLGDVAKFGQQVEGFGAIGAKRAQELYQRISDIQREYVGAANFDKLQKEYAAASRSLEPYGKGLGKRIVGADGTAMLDPTRVSSATFYSPDRVRLAKQLTSGSPEVIDQAAREYVSRSLAGKTAAEAKRWVEAAKKNGWMKEVKGLEGEVASYLQRVEKIERVEEKLRASGKKFSTGAKDVMTSADKRVGEISKEAYAGLVKATDKIREGGFAKEEVSRLIRTGSQAENQAAARLMMGQPGGRVALTEAITRELAHVPQNKIADAWDSRYRDLLFKSGLMPQKELEAMEVRVQRALQEGKSPKFIHALITSGITFGISTLGRLQREFGRTDEDVLEDIGGQ